MVRKLEFLHFGRELKGRPYLHTINWRKGVVFKLRGDIERTLRAFHALHDTARSQGTGALLAQVGAEADLLELVGLGEDLG